MNKAYKEKVNNYIACIPGDSIRQALQACRDYVDAVFDAERHSQEGPMCSDAESRAYWQFEMKEYDRIRRNTHDRLIRSILAANHDAENFGMQPLFPLKDTADRVEIGDLAGKVVGDYFNNRRR